MRSIQRNSEKFPWGADGWFPRKPGAGWEDPGHGKSVWGPAVAPSSPGRESSLFTTAHIDERWRTGSEAGNGEGEGEGEGAGWMVPSTWQFCSPFFLINITYFRVPWKTNS